MRTWLMWLKIQITRLEWSMRCGCMVGFGSLKMFSFWLHGGEIEYELNAKSNLINNIRFNQTHWMICTHTKSPTDVRLVCECVCVCDMTARSHEWCLIWFGLILVCAIGHTIIRSRSTLHFAEWFKLMMLLLVDVFQTCPIQNLPYCQK